MRPPKSLLTAFFVAAGILASFTSCGTRDKSLLTADEVVNSPKLLDHLYTMQSTEPLGPQDNPVEVAWYKLNPGEQTSNNNLPEAVVIAKDSHGKQIKIPLMSALIAIKCPYSVLKTQTSILSVHYDPGGTAWNSHKHRIVSLSKEHSLEILGDVSYIQDIDGDGSDDLLTTEDIWEEGLGIFGHAGAPRTWIFWKADGNTLIQDSESHRTYYENEIKRIAGEIENSPTMAKVEYLSLILSKFLNYRVMGCTEEEWQEFNRDIQRFDNESFPSLAGDREIPIAEIEKKMRESLGG
ncbi:MAG TPA: hypothetical protein PLQ35_07035 [bacterium]|nr:hypothetical protein [bacterium]HQL62032.1 hypothetical protein [bacterium]